MLPIRSLLGLLLLTTLTPGCRTQPPQLPPFDGERAYAEVEALVAFSPRDAGTEGGRAAAEHILRRLESFGLEARIDTFSDVTPAGEKSFRNVVAQIPGKNGRWIILGSHFDTMPGIPGFQGANDSGSSTGTLLELARMLGEHHVQPETGLLFAFFDGEEGIAGYIPGDGLHGSRRLAMQLMESGMHRRVDAMLLLDMVGDADLHFTLPSNSSPDLVRQLLDAARALGHRDRFSLKSGYYVTDDHVPFLKIGIPAVDLIDFTYGSAPGLNDYWHTPKDHLEHIRAESLGITGNIVLRMLENMAYPTAE